MEIPSRNVGTIGTVDTKGDNSEIIEGPVGGMGVDMPGLSDKAPVDDIGTNTPDNNEARAIEDAGVGPLGVGKRLIGSTDVGFPEVSDGSPIEGDINERLGKADERLSDGTTLGNASKLTIPPTTFGMRPASGS